MHDQGDFPAALASAKSVVRHRYEVPFVSHAPLEPQNCYAWVQKDKAHVIAPNPVAQWRLTVCGCGHRY